MDKLKMHSLDFSRANVARLAEQFPNCVTEAQGKDGEIKPTIDFDLLRQELSKVIVDGPRERYQLDWPGKREALLAANTPIAKTLRPVRETNLSFNSARHLLIEGDNLEVLKLLQETYLNRIKMIYIDPPYNTGRDFINDDDFSQRQGAYRERSKQEDAEGNRLVANTEANGRFHSDWLTMLYPRLKLARNLLRDDGVVFISIDDNELQSLRQICTEIFGEQNFVATIVWQKVYAPKNSANWFSEDHDYILVFAKSKNCWRPKPEPEMASIFDMGRRRVQNVISELTTEDKTGADAPGFRALKVDSSNMKDVYYTPDALKKEDLFGLVDNIKPDRSPEDLLFQVLLDWGVDLALPIAREILVGKQVFFVDTDALAACFDEGVDEELVKTIAERKPLRVVFRDASFSNDSMKINAEQIFKTLSPGTEVRAI